MGKFKNISLLINISLFSLFYSCSQEATKNNDYISNGIESRIPEDPNNGKVNVDPVLKGYIGIVKEKLRGLGVSDAALQNMDYVNLKFGSVKKPAVGNCFKEFSVDEYGNIKKINFREITIDKNQWDDNLNNDIKIAIIAHEYGHCAWGFDHLNVQDHIMSEVASYKIDDNAWQYFAYQINNYSNLNNNNSF